MLITASQQNTRQAPRKVRLVANQVRKLSLAKAIEQLGLIERRSSLVILKTVRQAIANAQHNHGLSFEDLTLKNIVVTEGPRYRRFQAVSRGRAHGIIKRTSSITVTLESMSVGKADTAAASQKTPAKVKEVVKQATTQSSKKTQPTTQELSKAASAQERSAKKTVARSSAKQVRSTTRPKKGAK